MDRIEEDSKEGDASMETDEEVNSTESVEKKGPPIAPPAKKNKSPKKLNPSILENYIPAHWKDKTETRGIKLGSVWDLAGMPESYFGDSDPEAETPVRSNSIKDFDVTTGSYGACPFMDDYSLEDESADVQLQFDLDKHNITDPTEDSENLRKIVATVTKDDAQDGDEIRHSLALTITGEEEEDDDNDTITPSSTSEGTDSGEEKLLGWPVTEEESSASFKDAEQTWIDSSDASTQPHEVAVVNVEHSVSPDIAWPRAHAKGEWTQIEDSTTVKVAHAHAKGEWAQTKGSSAIKVEYLQFFTPELGKVTNEMNKVIMGAPKPAASSKKQDGFNLQPTKAASMSRLVAPPIPSPDGSVTDERKVEAHNNASVASSKQLDLFSPQPSMPRVKGAAHDESASDDDDESKVVKEVPRSTPNTPFKALDDAASVSSEKASPLPTQDENVTDNRSTPITFSKALDFPIPQPSNNAASVVSPEKMSSMPTQDENVTDDVSKVVKELLNFSIPQPPSKAASIGCFSPEKASTTQDENAIIDQSNIVVRKATRSSSSSSTLVALSKETTGSMSSPSLELLSPISLQDFASPDNSILKSWAQSVMNKLKTDKDQKLLSM